MEIKWRRKRPSKKKPDSYLFIALYGPDSECMIYTGERIGPGEWVEGKNGRGGEPRGKLLTRASIIMAEVERARMTLEGQGEDVTPSTVRDLYQERREAKETEASTRDKQRRQNAQGLSALADIWVANDLSRYKHSTQKSIKESLRAFQEYLKSIGRAGMQRQELTHELISRYEKHLQEKIQLSNATHGKRMKHLRWFLKSLDFDTSKIKLRSFQKPIIALTLKELEALELFDVGDSIEKQKAKDLFLLGCYTGQRISDLKTIRPSLLENGFLKIKQTKSGKIISQRLMARTIDILKRYEYHAPNIAEQHLNENIKLICKDAGIDVMVERVSNKAGFDVKEDLPKWQLITSHISGKTCISTVCPERYNMTPSDTAKYVGKNLKTLIGHYHDPSADAANKKIIEADRVLKVAK